MLMNQPAKESNPPKESPLKHKPYETPVLEQHGKLTVVIGLTTPGGG
jgi:hypothetical protein